MASLFCELNGPLIFGLYWMKCVINLLLYGFDSHVRCMCALLLSTACHVTPHVLFLFSAIVNVVDW